MRAAGVCCARRPGATRSTIMCAARVIMFVAPAPTMAAPTIGIRAVRRPAMDRVSMVVARPPAMASVSIAAVMEELPIRMAVRAFRRALPLARPTVAGRGVAAVADAGGTDRGFGGGY